MANEQFIDRRDALLLARESSYATDATPGVGDAVFITEVESNLEQETIEVDGIAAYAAGWRGVPGPRTPRLTFGTLMGPCFVTDATSRADVDAALAAMGFAVPAYAIGAPKTLTYTRPTTGASVSATAVHHKSTHLATATARRRMTGYRCTGSLSWSWDGVLRLALSDGAAKTWAEAASTMPTATYTDVEGNHYMPFVGTRFVMSLETDESVPTVYGGNMFGGTLDFNMGVEIDRGCTAAGLPVRVRHRPGRATGTIQVERVPLADWDPRTYLDTGIGMTITPQFVSPEDANLTLDVTIPAEIVSVGESIVDGRAAWDLTWRALYPAGGTVPAADITLVYTNNT
jgi:hypothetical protein